MVYLHHVGNDTRMLPRCHYNGYFHNDMLEAALGNSPHICICMTAGVIKGLQIVSISSTITKTPITW